MLIDSLGGVGYNSCIKFIAVWCNFYAREMLTDYEYSLKKLDNLAKKWYHCGGGKKVTETSKKMYKIYRKCTNAEKR